RSPPRGPRLADEAAHDAVVRAEFDRAATLFKERTRGRFDHMGPVEFSRSGPGETVVEVGAGTGNFLALFRGDARRLVGVDLTPAMLARAREHGGLHLVAGDGRRLPLRSQCADLVASAQALHHIHDPLSVVKEMRRVARPGGRVLLVDQVATERFEEAATMTELEIARDPSHAVSRPPSAYRIMARAAGLEILDEKVSESEQRLSAWMWPGEFPEERIAAVRDLIEKFGPQTGMGFERDGDDWVFVRRRLMLLAGR
ncbi:MAG: class I SAM-dependent methyltransferase, partial [Actinomycetota bacterium]|nr:class I SAM-dependent methyltransferase [Actinomycetota bacterium]